MILEYNVNIIESEYIQILIAHYYLSVELRIHIPAPTLDTSLIIFIKQINQKKDN